nr:hypothetical protein BaRGS_016722 [Batillaria attramentaria]
MSEFFTQGLTRLQFNGELDIDVVSFVFYPAAEIDGVQQCPDWEAVWDMALEPCYPSIAMAAAASSLEDGCYHYRSTLLCGAFLMKVNNFDCGLDHLQQLAENDELLFKNQSSNLDLPEECKAYGQPQFSVDLKTTPACEVPEALVYVAEYHCQGLMESSEDSSSMEDTEPEPTPESEPEPTAESEPDTTTPANTAVNVTTPRSATTASIPTMHGFPSNPCSRMLTRTSCITSAFNSLGLQCSFQNLGPRVMGAVTAAQTDRLQDSKQEAGQCLEYMEKIGGGDPCLNTSNESLQQCISHLVPFFTQMPVSGESTCRSLSEAVTCLSKQSPGCERSSTRQSVIQWLSYMYTHHALANVTLVPGLNFRAMELAFWCVTDGAGPEHTTLPSGVTATTTPPKVSMQDPMFILNVTINAFWGDSLYNESSVEFVKMAAYIESQVDAILNASDISGIYHSSDVVVMTPGSIRAGVAIFMRLLSTILNPNDRYVYGQLSKDDGSLMRAHFAEGMERLKLQGMEVMDMSFYNFSRASDVDPSFSQDLDVTPICLVRDAHQYVLSYICNSGQDADSYSDVSEAVGEVIYTSSLSELTKEFMECKEYAGRLSGGDPCFNQNRTDCLYQLAIFQDSTVSVGSACSALSSAAGCLASYTQGQCSAADSRKSIIQWMSFFYTYYAVGNVSMVPGINFRNVEQMFQCSGGEGVVIGPSNRVFVWREGIWTSICGQEWDDKDATVVCRQLGYSFGHAFVR